MTLMHMTIDQQLSRLARDIAAAADERAMPAMGEPIASLTEVERRAQCVARDVIEQLGATMSEDDDDEIDAALELVLRRLLDPAPPARFAA
jgi:hypothetical protein